MTAADEPLDRLRFVEVAHVYKKRTFAATLERTKAETQFRYNDHYEGPAIASTLPLREPRFCPAGAVPPFFAGLLPEGRRLLALRRSVKTSADDDLTLLLAVGRDVIGDVQVVPEGEDAQVPAPIVAESALGALRFDDLFVRVSEGRVVAGVALPGVQEKIPVHGRMSVPLDVDEGHYILKLNPPEYPHLVENEAYFLDGARRCGLRVAEARVVRDAVGAPGLLVSRFDRRPGPDGTIGRLAQEDGCQATDRYPADKYNLTTEEVIETLSRMAFASRATALDLFRQVAFAYLTGNGDMHAKNLSVVEDQGEFRASPAYDVPSTHPYGDVTMALSIGSQLREDITRKSFQRLAQAIDVPEKAADRALDELLDRFEPVVTELDALPFDARARHKLQRVMRDRMGKLGSKNGG